jgi:hypothetical protein
MSDVNWASPMIEIAVFAGIVVLALILTRLGG